MKISIILPTLTGRETITDLVLGAFEQTRPSGWEFDVIIPEDYPEIGSAWNAGADDADADYVFFAIDDGEMHPGWAEVAVQTADAGYVPAPRMVFPDGSLESCGSMGYGQLLGEADDCTPCRNTGVIFAKHDWVGEVGAFLPIHYGVDDDWNWRASLQGHLCLYRAGMRITHHHVLDASQHVRTASREHHAAVLAHAATLTLPGRDIGALKGPVCVA